MLYWIILFIVLFALASLIFGTHTAIIVATYVAVFVLGFCYGWTARLLSLIKFEEHDDKSQSV